jgi:hypothetical protein
MAKEIISFTASGSWLMLFFCASGRFRGREKPEGGKKPLLNMPHHPAPSKELRKKPT